MARKGGLGKGLDAILPAEIAERVFGEMPAGERLREIDVSEISPNPLQPRDDIDPEGLEQLAESIRQQGILQPIIVAPTDDGYVLIAGERRWRAVQLVGREKIPAIVLERKPDDEQLLFMALVENLQREDLDPVEEAEAYRTLAKQFGLRQEEIAQRVGKSRPAVANAMRLLKLPETILSLLRSKKITAGHARILLEEKSPDRQLRLAQLTVRRGLSVERLSILVLGKQARKKRSRRKNDPKILALEDELAISLGTKVEIVQGKRKSRLIIEFYSEEELLELAERLAGDGAK